MNYYKYLLIIFLLLSYVLPCTIGVGWDGDEPVLWKNRDQETYSQSEVKYINVEGSIGYTQVTTLGSNSPYMGMNDKGFAIVNSLVQSDTDINSDLIRFPIDDEYELIKEALKTCETVSDFNTLLLELIPTAGSDNHIQSNFAVIDNSGIAAIFEVDTFSDFNSVLIDSTYLGSDDIALYRSNHFQNLENPSDYNQLDSIEFECENLNISDAGLKGNARRWCASKEYFDNLNFDNSSIIKYLIEADPSLNNNRGSLLRSLTRYTPNNSDIFYYQLPYKYQLSYDCGSGRPTGYIYSNYSIARNKTTSSVVMKSIQGDTDNSFILVALGNPLFTPYIPIKVSDFEDIQLYSSDYHNFSSDSFDLYHHIFDYSRNDIPWVDAQHLVPTNEPDYPLPNHDGTFAFIRNIENNYLDLINGSVIETLINANNLISNFYTDYINGFSSNYDDPRYSLKLVDYEYDPSNSCDDRPIYDFEDAEFSNRTFHIDMSLSNHTWKIENDDNSGHCINMTYPFNEFNPMVKLSDWNIINNHNIGQIINLYYKDSSGNYMLVRDNIQRGCTNPLYLEYNSVSDVDDGSCVIYIDINEDDSINVLDVTTLVNMIFDESFTLLADINADGALNILDIAILINFILS
ncbi:dockerin type I domain-containing protein [bacterium]|nr:dockerin type I domain-containing protein [bacterium]